jgi:hypothetical protein
MEAEGKEKEWEVVLRECVVISSVSTVGRGVGGGGGRG